MPCTVHIYSRSSGTASKVDVCRSCESFVIRKRRNYLDYVILHVIASSSSSWLLLRPGSCCVDIVSRLLNSVALSGLSVDIVSMLLNSVASLRVSWRFFLACASASRSAWISSASDVCGLRKTCLISAKLQLVGSSEGLACWVRRLSSLQPRPHASALQEPPPAAYQELPYP